MLKGVFDYFQQPVLAVVDSWFGNDGLWSRLDRGRHGDFHLLSRLRINITLFDLPPVTPKGVKRKPGFMRVGCRVRQIRRHKIRGCSGFAFSDVRRILAEAALNPDFQSICPCPVQTPQNPFINTLLRMVA